jgi:hemerythrin-like metal-binding protein
LTGFFFIGPSSSNAWLIVWMLISGTGSGMFFSPNTKSIMQTVPVEKRGIAAGIRTMMNNGGNVISLAMAMAIISSSITPEALSGLFLGIQVGSKGIAVNDFISGLRVVFMISFAFTLLAAFISYLREPDPVWNDEWAKELSLDIMKFDEQHRELLSLISKLDGASKGGKGDPGAIFNDLINYSIMHFAYEEMMMKEYIYPGLPFQNDENSALIRRVIEFQDNFKKGSLNITPGLVDSIKEGMAGHITRTDKKFEAYFGEIRGNA